MTERILLGTDGTAATDQAVEYAVALADALDATLDIVHVLDEGLIAAVDYADAREELADRLETEGTSTLERTASLAESIPVETYLASGRPHRKILEAADGADLIVLGRNPEQTARTPIGTTTFRVVAEAPIPVLSVPAVADLPSGRFRRVLVPTDGSDFPDRAANIVTDWMVSEGHIDGLYVIDADIYHLADAPRSIIGLLREGGERALDDLGTIAADADLAFERHLRRGTVVETITDTIDDVAPDVVAMGTRGQAAGTTPLLGSTTAAVLLRTNVPVLTAP